MASLPLTVTCSSFLTSNYVSLFLNHCLLLVCYPGRGWWLGEGSATRCPAWAAQGAAVAQLDEHTKGAGVRPHCCRHGAALLCSTAKATWQEVRHLLPVAAENNRMVFSSLNRCQELPATAKQRKAGRPASPAHQPHHPSAPECCLHGFPVPGMGQQWGDAAGLAGSQAGAQGTVGHHRGPRGGVEGRPHHFAELRHGVPGKMLTEGVLDYGDFSSILISVFQSLGPFIIRECGCFHCVSQVTIVTKLHCLLF